MIWQNYCTRNHKEVKSTEIKIDTKNTSFPLTPVYEAVLQKSTHAHCRRRHARRMRTLDTPWLYINRNKPPSCSTFSHFDNVGSCGTLLYGGFAGSQARGYPPEGFYRSSSGTVYS